MVQHIMMVATPHVLHIHESTPGSWFTRLGAGVLPHGVQAGRALGGRGWQRVALLTFIFNTIVKGTHLNLLICMPGR